MSEDKKLNPSRAQKYAQQVATIPGEPEAEPGSGASDRTGIMPSAEAPDGGVGDEKQATVVVSPVSQSGKDEGVAQPTLEVVAGKANRKIFQLGNEKLSMGRVSYNDVVLSDGKVSRSHAVIYFEKGHYVVEDLNSTNGVYVDGKQVNKSVLKSGNRIALGDAVLLFTQAEPEVSQGDKLAFINKSDLFNWLDEETKMLLAQNLTVRFFPKDTVVLKQNAPVESMYFLYSGDIRVVEINEEGGERVIDRVTPGDFFGERALLAGESGKYSMITNSDIHVLELRKERLNELLLKKPDLNKAFYRMVLKKLSSAQVTPDREDRRQDNLKHIITPTDVQIIGEDKRIKEAKKKIEALAKEEKSVLIVGPSGTGKKTFARYFHKNSPHPDYPYVEVSIAEQDKAKVGAVIFGVEPDPDATHMKGQVGYLEMIGNGTLAITHAEQLDAHQQSKLATYIKQGWFHRVYGRESVKSKTNVLLVATGTETELAEKFIPELRELLQDRTVLLPSLLQRLKDIPVLAEHYLKVFGKQNGKRITGLSREANERLVSYTWPGNVKELENVIQRAAIVTSENVIIPGDLIFVIPSEKDIHKINIVRQDRIRDILRHPLVPKVFVWFNILMVLVMAGFTLFGGTRPPDDPLQDSANNPGMLITWLIWFPILPISAFLIGRVWCGMCPIAGIGELVSRVARLNLPVPKILKRMDFWMVVICFVFLDYVEELASVADKPWATGMLLVIIIGLSVLFCVLFERKTFCRYVCPLAGMLGTYSTLSMVEVRGNKKICQTQCGQHLCYKGSEHAQGCPMFSYPASLSTNSECMMCLNCLKSCENRGVQINVRPPLQELWRQSQPVLSVSFFGVMMVGLMARHQFPKLASWVAFQEALNWPDAVTHTLVFLSFILMAVIPFLLSSTLSAAASQEKVSENMAHYGLAFIPLALSGHLAHIFHEFLRDGVYKLLEYFIKLYDFVIGAIPIGSREVAITHFVHPAVVNFIKFMIISGGMLGSFIALVMIARKWSDRNVLGRIMPHLMLLFFFGLGYLYVFMGSTDAAPRDLQAQTAVSQPSSSSAGAPVSTAQPAGTTAHSPGVTASPGTTAPPVHTPPVQATPTIGFSLISPDVKNATSMRLDNPGVSRWLQMAKIVPTTKQYRLTIQGQVSGVPAGSQVRASLDAGSMVQQFAAGLDAKGVFSGDIFLGSINQRIPLVFQVLEPKSGNILFTQRIVFY